MHYILSIYFGTNKILCYKFIIQISHSLKKSIIIIKTYHIITIDITAHCSPIAKSQSQLIA